MTSNPATKPVCIFLTIHFFSDQTEKQIYFTIRKPGFS